MSSFIIKQFLNHHVPHFPGFKSVNMNTYIYVFILYTKDMTESLINVEFYPNSVSCQHGTPFCKKKKVSTQKVVFSFFHFLSKSTPLEEATNWIPPNKGREAESGGIGSSQ